MKLNDILAVVGQPGLYKYVAQSARGGVIVESLTGGVRSSVAAHTQVSALSEISMFTISEDIPLVEIFTRLLQITGGGEATSHKESPAKIKEAFEQLLPEYDRERVHISDMKKCFMWFNLLIGVGATSFEVESEQEEQSEE